MGEKISIPAFAQIFDIDEIQKIQDAFAKATAVSAIITDTNGNAITRPGNFCRLCREVVQNTRTGRAKCVEFYANMAAGHHTQEGPVFSPCPGPGLWNARIAVTFAGNHVANWIIGQIRNEKTDAQKMLAYADVIGADHDAYAAALGDVTAMSVERFTDISHSLFLITEQLSEQAYQKLQYKQTVSSLKKSKKQLHQKTRELQTTMDNLMEAMENNQAMEARLRQSQKMEAIGTLAGGIAHDFNNILFPILGFSEMIMQDLPQQSPVRDQMQSVINGAVRARELVQQILTFSRETEQDCRPLKLQLIVKEVLKLARASLPATIKIFKNIPNKVGMVKADPTQMHQVILNLISNALHAMEENGGELTVSLSEADFSEDTLPAFGMAPGSYVCLKVADTGQGMDPEICKRIFEPYFTTKVRGKGTGLGLAVVHGIVENLDGKIFAHSTKGQGTAFYLYLPRFTREEVRCDETKKAAVPCNGNEKILLIDDEASVLHMMEALLSRSGYRVTACDMAQQGLTCFTQASREFDLVITDMTMPEMTGDKLVAALKKVRADIPVILCTGCSENTVTAKTGAAAPDKILMKPATSEDLLASIRNLLDN
ncbi:MAG TPA: PocR ligand-binding domain-containing protein [Desulfotignum sp.]|nr:PocR ligand-binding domain-containing protein [Desulfotignum sp.]